MDGYRYLLLPLLWLAIPAWAGIDLEPVPAWEGYMVPGRDTELGLRLVSDRQDSFDLELSAPGFSLHYKGRLEPDLPLQVWLPVRPGPSGRLGLRLHSNESQHVSLEIRFLPRSHRFSVRAGPGDGAFLVATIHDLPRTAAGYDPVNHLLMDPGSIAGLDMSQARALSRYMGDCGRLQIINAGSSLLEEFRKTAGCGGRFVTTRDEVQSNPLPAVAAERLLTLHSASGGSEPATWLAGFFLVYMLMFWAMYRTLRRQVLLLLVPPIAGVALTVTSNAMPPRSSALVLVETVSGAHQGRLSGLFMVEGNGLNTAQLPLIAGLRLPRSLGDDSVRLIQDPDDPARFLMPVETRFLARSGYAVEGAINLVSRAVVDDSGTSVQLVNRGSAPLPPGVLVTNDTLIATPPLAPGKRWSPRDGNELLEWDALAGLLRERAGKGSAWILPLPHEDFGLLAGHDKATGWLLVHGNREWTL